MRRVSLFGVLALATLDPGGSAALAHLGVPRTSLVALLGGGNGVLVARAESATDESGRTGFSPLVAIGGDAPSARFDVSGAEPLLRYRPGEFAVVVLRCVARSSRAVSGGEPACERWGSPQTAGAGIAIERAEDVESVAPVVRRLWAAVQEGPGLAADQAATRALVDALGTPARKLRYSAALDLAVIAHHPAWFSSEARQALAAYGSRSDGDPALGPLIATLLHTLDQGGER